MTTYWWIYEYGRKTDHNAENKWSEFCVLSQAVWLVYKEVPVFVDLGSTQIHVFSEFYYG